MAVLFASEIIATTIGISDFESSNIDLYAYPFTIDMVCRGLYAAAYIIQDIKIAKQKAAKNINEENLNNIPIRSILENMTYFEMDGVYPPGLIGFIRQKCRYKHLTNTYEDK